MEKDIAEKKQAIYESTLELIKEHGFHGATMNLVSKKASVAAGTIYHYFDSKEQLICELYDYSRSKLVSVVTGAIQAERSYKENFFHIWRSLYDFYLGNPNVLIFFEQFVNSPYNADKYPNHFRGELYNFFAKGISEGELKSLKPEILLVLVLGSISSTAKLHLYAKVSVTKHDVRRISEILWDGITVSSIA
jgi:TetR/AcrR family transcriptional repressor of multidrug resistance operon